MYPQDGKNVYFSSFLELYSRMEISSTPQNKSISENIQEHDFDMW